MRINLNVKYEEKDEARRLGAWWDAARKTWYIQNIEDITPFMKWINREPVALRLPKAPRNEAKQMKPKFTTSDPKPHCGCYHVAPWEHCEHTMAMEEGFELTEMDLEAERHLRSI